MRIKHHEQQQKQQQRRWLKKINQEIATTTMARANSKRQKAELCLFNVQYWGFNEVFNS